MNISQLKLERLSKEGLETLIDWADAEGWNPGPYDSIAYWNADSNGFYGFYSNGELIAGGSLVSYNDEFGFMGFFIVKPEYRSKGIGKYLWIKRRDLLISRLNANASIGMDGVIAMQDFYKKGGFHIAFRDERHQLIGQKQEVDSNISNIKNEDFEDILEFDKACFGFDRRSFLEEWLFLPESYSFKLSLNGSLEGFAVLRTANQGFKIGPLFAKNSKTANELLKACLNAVPGSEVFIDIPMKNEYAIGLLSNYNTKYIFECARMYYGDQPKMKLNYVYGITTFELG